MAIFLRDLVNQRLESMINVAKLQMVMLKASKIKNMQNNNINRNKIWSNINRKYKIEPNLIIQR